MDLDFEIFKPQGLLAGQIQAIWSVSVAPETEQTVRRQLLSDAGTGVTFILQQQVQMDNEWQAPGVVLLPVSTLAHQVGLPPGAIVAGVRFHPAVGYQLFGERLETPLRIAGGHPLAESAQTVFLALQSARSPASRITTLYRWCHALIAQYQPQDVGHIIHRQPETLSQRQRERQFQKWLGITPKQYQRIVRVKQTLEQLRAQPHVSLADLALEQGFADQAHMTRECKQIARITPKQFVRQRKS
ncbi:helix-turn-helix domain-containing protein [Vibrio fluvialis]|uniref:helix-turn-helix domain-containing protein n=1 Tax=Vibrio fluvialis TaxID=676 RepID=UPI001BB06EE8|nr:helix-turn-helix domain-containing protein [Vibrio fluvialis]EKO3499547.1 AraC family transcriptional regulator [Vibrio fluvialis]EKO3971574.1 AraC family transcriptional regulator [Vibrio fluvialis]EKZ9000608.1 AraC family transcriptional regulator [Vibrio fluvialis]ELI1829387.1 AraC family transcriptional regulator [Vibrio fluvialis]QUF70955.1 AraC family transcriptional regulator [Vibrio fluvialis]